MSNPIFMKKVYSKFLLALGFILFGAYTYSTSDSLSVKALCCLGVGIGYLVYGIYTYMQQRKRGAP
jgi:hypothetical protein